MKIINYIKKLIESKSKESSKRFMALWTMLIVTICVFVFTRSNNFIDVLELLLGFILVLMGVAVWQSIKNNKNEKL